ncbi:MAG: hypothetical protein JOS17DRAFT_598530 [Linnemannia elongata]|nr:MAG: hypothetical protein JOS17DRAFT_598530 [Linnemannia elongata]
MGETGDGNGVLELLRERERLFFCIIVVSLSCSLFFLLPFLDSCSVCISSLIFMATRIPIGPSQMTAYSPHSLDIAMQHACCISTCSFTALGQCCQYLLNPCGCSTSFFSQRIDTIRVLSTRPIHRSMESRASISRRLYLLPTYRHLFFAPDKNGPSSLSF